MIKKSKTFRYQENGVKMQKNNLEKNFEENIKELGESDKKIVRQLQIDQEKEYNEPIKIQITDSIIDNIILNIKGHHVREGRALLILLYLTGCHATEALKLKGSNFSKVNNYWLSINFMYDGKNKARIVKLRLKDKFVSDLASYAFGCFSNMYLFYNYQSHYERKNKTEIGSKLNHYIKKWFEACSINEVSLRDLKQNRRFLLKQQKKKEDYIREFFGDLSPLEQFEARKNIISKKIARSIE